MRFSYSGEKGAGSYGGCRGILHKVSAPIPHSSAALRTGCSQLFLLQRNADGSQCVWGEACLSCPTASDWLRVKCLAHSLILTWTTLELQRSPWDEVPAETTVLSIVLCPPLSTSVSIFCSSSEHVLPESRVSGPCLRLCFLGPYPDPWTGTSMVTNLSCCQGLC